MEKAQFKCTGNCLGCLPAQRAYCSSQHSYSNMKVLDSIMEKLISLQEDVKTISEKIEVMQNSEASIFDPHEEPIAQKRGGAEE